MQVKVMTKLASAIRRGRLTHGESEITIAAWDGWSDVERELLSRCVDISPHVTDVSVPAAFRHPHESVAVLRGSIIVDEATPAGLLATIRDAIERDAAVVAEHEARKAAEREQTERDRAARVAKLREEHAARGASVLIHHAQSGYVPDAPPNAPRELSEYREYAPVEECPPDLLEVARAQAAEVTAIQRQGLFAGRAKLVAERAAKAAQESAAQEALRALWLRLVADDCDREREQAGYVSAKEQRVAVLDKLLGSEGRYAPIEACSLPCECDEGVSVVVSCEQPTLSREGYAALRDLRAKAVASVAANVPDATVEVTAREHIGTCTARGCDETTRRLGCLVTIKTGALVLTREFAQPR